MVANVLTGMVQGVEGIMVRVEADISSGLPMINLFGSLSSEAKEGKDRVRTALKNMGIHLPASRITINLAPGDIRKSGTSFDLAIAAALFLALGLISEQAAEDIIFLGEISLDGSLLPVHGVLPILKTARDEGYKRCIVPDDNLEEASLLEGMEAVGFDSLKEVYDYLQGDRKEEKDAGAEITDRASEEAETSYNRDTTVDGDTTDDRDTTVDRDITDNRDTTVDRDTTDNRDTIVDRDITDNRDTTVDRDITDNRDTIVNPDISDFADVRGQELAKRALEIAVAGFHNVLLDGPPGVGKSMVASCVPGIMPEMTMEEKIETTMIYSVKGLLGNNYYLVKDRPFRSPSHNITMMGMFGGGSDPVPGEISLAHHGVLFLDEIPEYGRDMIEQLRVPLENHRIILVRNNRTIEFPADFILIAASNPCPCGYYPDRGRCRCSNREIRRYQNRISGPMRDRIDLFVRCEEVSYETLTSPRKAEPSSQIRHRVSKAWDVQRQRSVKKGRPGYHFNGRMTSAEVREYCSLTEEGSRMMAASFRSLGLSGRSYYRVLKVARTIADLAGEESIHTIHLEEALLFRNVIPDYNGYGVTPGTVLL